MMGPNLLNGRYILKFDSIIYTFPTYRRYTQNEQKEPRLKSRQVDVLKTYGYVIGL